MNDHNETTANTASEPKLCKMNCGFFGSNALGDCCSKCYNSMQQKKEVSVSAPAPTPAAVAERPASPVTEPTAPVTADISEFTNTPEPAVIATAAAASPLKKKKKKKAKASYKNMMAGVMEGGPRDIAKEKENLRKVTGGGEFSKVDKI